MYFDGENWVPVYDETLYQMSIWAEEFLFNLKLEDRLKALTVNEDRVSEAGIHKFGGPTGGARPSGDGAYLVRQVWITLDSSEALRTAWDAFNHPPIRVRAFDGNVTRILFYITPQLSGIAAEIAPGEDVSWTKEATILSGPEFHEESWEEP